jgi:hypothetical protein
MGDDFVTVVVKEDGVVSGVEVTESKFVEGMDDEVKVTATSTTLTLSRSLSSLASPKPKMTGPTSTSSEAETELLSPLYMSRKAKFRKISTCAFAVRYTSSAASVGRGQSETSECLFDDCTATSDSPLNMRKCSSSSVADREYKESNENMVQYRKHHSFTWSPTNIRTSSSLFSDFVDDEKLIENIPEKKKGILASIGAESACEDDKQERPEENEALHGVGFFTWSPSAIRTPMSKSSAAPTPQKLSREPIITFSASTERGSIALEPLMDEGRDPSEDPRGSASDTCTRHELSTEELIYDVPPEDNPSFEWSAPASTMLLSPPVSALTDETSELSIPREVILKREMDSIDAVETESVSDTAKNQLRSVSLNDMLFRYQKSVRQLSKSVGDGASLSDNNILIRFGEWAARNPFLGACSPHPGDWESLQSSSFTDVESSIFSSCCSSTEEGMNLDTLIKDVMEKRQLNQPRSRSNTGSSISDILGEFRRDDAQPILCYSADDESSGKFGIRLRVTPFAREATPKSVLSEFTHTTTLELGPTTIRTKNLRALTVIMGKLAQTVAREALTPTLTTVRQLAVDNASPISLNLRLGPPSTPAESTGACVNETDPHETLREIMFLQKETTSSIYTETGAMSLDSGDFEATGSVTTISPQTEVAIEYCGGDDILTCSFSGRSTETGSSIDWLSNGSGERKEDFEDAESSVFDAEDDSLALSQSSSSVWFADHHIDPLKSAADSSTAMSSEEALSLVHDDALRAVIMLSDCPEDSSLLFPSFTLSATFSTVESDDGLREELGALNDAREELRQELENANFIMHSIFPPTEAVQGAEDADQQAQEVKLTDVLPNEGSKHKNPESSGSSGSVRRVRFSSNVEEFVFIRDARSPSEDSCDTFGAFLSSRLESIFCAVRDMVDEWECGADTSDDLHYAVAPPTPPHPHQSQSSQVSSLELPQSSQQTNQGVGFADGPGSPLM